jgi:predicted type IV restriction endonuclease
VRQAYNYAGENGIRFVVVTNGDYYALFDRLNGLSYDANFVGEFSISKLSEAAHPLIRFLMKTTMTSVVELTTLGASVTFPKLP